VTTVPVEITWVTGQIVSAAQLNANLRDAINFLLAPPMAVLRQTVSQSLPTGVWTPVNLDSEDLDRDGGHSTVTNTSRYTSQTPSWYGVDLTGSFTNAAATGLRGLAFRLNGVTKSRKQQAAGTTFPILNTSGKIFLNVGDYLESVLYQDTAVSLGTGTGEDQSVMQLKFAST
jgi:hypothetical protein